MKEKYSFSQYCSVRWAKQELRVKQGLISKIIIYKLFVQALVCQALHSAAAQSPKQSSSRTGAGGGGGRLTAGGNRTPEMLDAPPGRAFGREKPQAGLSFLLVLSFVQVPRFAVIPMPELSSSPVRAQLMPTAIPVPPVPPRGTQSIGLSRVNHLPRVSLEQEGADSPKVLA